jgi:hypothetical protein
VLALTADLRDEAASLLEAAWSAASSEWEEAAPERARALVHVLLAAGRTGDAARILDVAIPDAAAQGQLRELARLLAARVALLVATRAGADLRRDTLAGLRRVLDETGAARIAADTLLELALLLPANGPDRVPDPLALLDEAADLYAGMPIPAGHARCLEAAGDVLAARNSPAEAARRHGDALAILSRHGLGLRVPLLRRKAGEPLATT